MSAINSDNAVVVTIGIVAASQRAQLVFGLGDGAGLVSYTDPAMASGVADGVEADILPLLIACMSEESYISGLDVDPMADGGIPERRAYPADAYVGQRDGECVPISSGMLLAFYQDPASLSPGSRTRVAHTTVPGLSEDDQTGGIISGALRAALQSLGDKLIDGFVAQAGTEWVRLMHITTTAATNIERAIVAKARTYIGTIRKRMVPHV